MIVLDTNVLSELMRPRPDAVVLAWMNAQAASNLYTTSLTEAEILHGVALLPKGKRRDAIAAAAREMFDADFRGRVLSFGSDAARIYAQIVSTRRQTGRPISTLDAQIAAVTRSVDGAVATRNVADFDDCGVIVIDPWTAG